MARSTHCQHETLLHMRMIFLNIRTESTAPSCLMTPQAIDVDIGGAASNVDWIPGAFMARKSMAVSNNGVLTTQGSTTLTIA